MIHWEAKLRQRFCFRGCWCIWRYWNLRACRHFWPQTDNACLRRMGSRRRRNASGLWVSPLPGRGRTTVISPMLHPWLPMACCLDFCRGYFWTSSWFGWCQNIFVLRTQTILLSCCGFRLHFSSQFSVSCCVTS